MFSHRRCLYVAVPICGPPGGKALRYMFYCPLEPPRAAPHRVLPQAEGKGGKLVGRGVEGLARDDCASLLAAGRGALGRQVR